MSAKRKRPPKPCYLCNWQDASNQKPKRWIMCMDCYQLFSTSMIHNAFKQDCLKLYEYMYAAGQNRKDSNEDRAERFLAFLESSNNPPTERQIESIREEVHNYQEVDREPNRRKTLQVKPGGRSNKRLLSRGSLTRRPRDQKVCAQ